MKRRISKLLSLGVMISSILTSMQAVPAAAEEQSDAAATGTLAFAQCEEYINIRQNPDTDSEVVAKIYNHGAAEIEEQDGDWNKIRSGNAEGYVKAEYFATGAEAETIAEQAAYRVAEVYPDQLNVRTEPSEDSDVVTTASKDQELEVVSWDGDWMKVALGDDVYGYINAYYVGYNVYYPQAETLEEEQARLAAEQQAAESWNDASEISAENPQETVPETEAPYTEPETSAPETEAPETEAPWTEPETSAPETEAPWTEPETSAPETEAPWTEPETSAPETEAPWTEPETRAPETDAPWTEPETSAPETEAPWTEPETSAPETEAPWTEPETSAPETEAPWTEPETSAPETEAPSYGVGQQIADYAVQFVGNPYVWGGTSLTNGADCSGFTLSVFANFGIGLSRTAESQSYGGTPVDFGSLQPGDLIFYNSTGSIDHVAIYIGGGQIVHAANSRKGIIISDAYYQTPVCARRYW